jgi:hypothetical protein
MLLVPPILDLDGQCGDYTREQLLEMDAAFVARVESAFQAGLESRVAAGATVRLESSLNGAAEDAVIESAWRWFAEAKFQATAVEVLNFVRARSLSVTAERVRIAFKQRLFSRVSSWSAPYSR